MNRTALLRTGLAILLAGAGFSLRVEAQQHPIDYSPSGTNYSRGKAWYSTLFGQAPIQVAPVNLANSSRINGLLRNGKLYLSVDDAIALALENNLDIAIQRYNLQIADTDILRARAGQGILGTPTGIVSGTPGGGGPTTGGAGATGGGAGGTSQAAGGAGAGTSGIVTSTLGAGPGLPALDPNFTTDFSVEDAVTPQTNTFATGTNQAITHTTVGDFSFNKGFLPGTSLSVGFNNSRTTTNNIFSSALAPYFNSGLQISVTQPLLQGFGSSINGRNITIAKNNREVSDIAFRQQVMATVSQVEDIYWDYVSAFDAAAVAQDTVKLDQRVLTEDKRQIEIGTLAPITATQESSVLATDQQALIQAQTNLEYQELLLKNAITKNMADPVLASAHVVPTDKVQVPANEPVRPIQDLIRDALEYRPELAQSRINLRNQEISYKAVHNELMPRLDLFANYNAGGIAGMVAPINSKSPFAPNTPALAPFTGGWGHAINQAFAGNFPTYQAGITLQIPILNRSAQADVVRSQLELRQDRLQLQQQQNQIILEVRNAQFTLQQDRAAVLAAQQAVKYNQQNSNAFQKEFHLGAATITDVITAQNGLAKARNNLVVALTNYQEAKINLDRLTGRTLTHNRISIRDAENGAVTHMPQAQ